MTTNEPTPLPGCETADAPAPSLRVVLQSSRWVVVDKPSGLLSVPGKRPEHQDCVASRVREAFPHARGPLVVHRLDMDTSGLLVLALDPDAQRALSAQFEARTIGKSYTAIVSGAVERDEGLIDLPLRLDVERRPHQIVDFVHGRQAQTRYRVLQRNERATRLALEPLTGRTHQLRVHCAHVLGLDAPIIGDVLYGPRAPGPRLMLHADALEFDDPQTGARVRAHSPGPF